MKCQMKVCAYSYLITIGLKSQSSLYLSCVKFFEKLKGYLGLLGWI